MKRLLAFALIVTGLTFPTYAQRSASHGGFSGHTSQAFHGGFSPSSPFGIAGTPHYSGNRSFGIASGIQRGEAGNFRAHSTYPGARRYQRPYHSRYGAGEYYASPYYLSYPDDLGYDDSSVSPNDATVEYDASPAEQGELTPGSPSQAPSDLSHPSQTPESDEAVTLVFKDGRPPEQIHNYVLTQTTLFVRDHRHREIPIDQLDIAATAKVNHDAGVDFRLPGAPNS